MSAGANALLGVVPLAVGFGITKAFLDEAKSKGHTHYCRLCKKTFKEHEAKMHSHSRGHKVHKLPKRLKQ